MMDGEENHELLYDDKVVREEENSRMRDTLQPEPPVRTRHLTCSR